MSRAKEVCLHSFFGVQVAINLESRDHSPDSSLRVSRILWMVLHSSGKLDCVVGVARVSQNQLVPKTSTIDQ